MSKGLEAVPLMATLSGVMGLGRERVGELGARFDRAWDARLEV